MAKTLYTGHISVGDHHIYSFIYAETWCEAEEYLRSLLLSYARQRFRPPGMVPFSVKVVSRPLGWKAPDGYDLPATSKQYALKYRCSCPSRVGEKGDEEIEILSALPLS
jgi:hypothetical protein